MRRKSERGTALAEALIALGVLLPLVAALAGEARRAHARQAAQASLDAAAWSAAMGVEAAPPAGGRVISIGPWRVAEAPSGAASRRVPAW